MATQPIVATERTLALRPVSTFPRMRALAWHGDVLYASLGYVLYSAQMNASQICWREVGSHQPEWWRGVNSKYSLPARLFRDGFHALAILASGNLVGAVPGAIVTLSNGQSKFEVTHRIKRGTRPLRICVTPAGHVFWGEYFDNKERSEVHIYGSEDGGVTWQIVYTFAPREIRHIHNIIYDRWQDCLWVLTGDHGQECRILRASLDFRTVAEVLAGNQQARAVAAVPTREGLYFASDTPLEQNYIYCLDRTGSIHRFTRIPSSSIDGCQNSSGIFFSTMVEPSPVNRTRCAATFGSVDGENWRCLVEWKKDRWPMRFFQYGTAFFPAGENNSNLLAVSTIALEGGDRTLIFRASTS